MEIPEEYQQLCKDLAKVLRNFNYEKGWMNEKDWDKQKTIYNFSGKMSISDHKMSDIHFSWESGRHGDSQGQISISSTIMVNTKIDEKDSVG
jgi:ABC-type antimicrobial peptide transport system ATPase subunit